MSEFNVTTSTTSSAKDAAASLMQDFFINDDSGAIVAEHGFTADTAQMLALAGVTLDDVTLEARDLARTQNNYGIGRVFDVTTKRQLTYGRYVVTKVNALTSTTVVNSTLEYPGSYDITRSQIMINSELMKESEDSGVEYFYYMRAHISPVTGQPITGWNASDTKNKVNRRLKMYTTTVQEMDADGKSITVRKFWTERRDRVTGKLKRTGVVLGDPSVIDNYIAAAYANGAVQKYVDILNEFDQDFVEALSENQQQLFLSVFKTLKAQL